jgi:hypothetical protein
MSTQLACAQTQSHLTDKQLQNLMPDFQRQVEYWNQYEEPERQNEARAFAENWSRRAPAVAPFLGSWSGWEETMNIYPSTTDGQACIIYTSEPEANFRLGNIRNQRIYTDRGEVIFQQGNYVGVAWSHNKEADIEAGVNVYRLIAPSEVPTRESLKYWSEGSRILEQFKAAGCMSEASKRHSSLLEDAYWLRAELTAANSGSPTIHSHPRRTRK